MPKTASQEPKKSNRKKGLFFLFFSIFIGLSGLIGWSLFESEEPLFIRLNESEFTLTEGDSTLITFDASRQLGSFVYTSNNSSVVQFIENRLIAITPGNATITVSSQSNPSVFQTVSVIVRPRDIEPEVPVEPEPEVPEPVEPEPEDPVEPVEPEPEVPVEPEPEEETVTPPTIYTITITNETGAVITTLEVEEGSFITTTSLELPELFKGFFLEGETCTDEPFDLETPITENLTLIQASFNDEAPCLQLDYIVLSGRPVAGTELNVDIFPIGANVTISWYTSVNNRTYREIPGESGSSYTVRPEDSGKFIRVYVVSDSNPPVVRFDTIKLDVFGMVSSISPDIQTLINQGFIPISSPEDLIAITSTSLHNFAGVLLTEGGLSKSYALTNDIDLSTIPNWIPLGDSSVPFSGVFRGNDYTISNLSLSSNQFDQGLFGVIDGASFSNLTLDNFQIISTSNNSDYGFLAGESNGNLIEIINVIITNSSIIGADDQVGGLIGDVGTDLNVENVTVSATISDGREVGLIAGYVRSGVIVNITSAFVYGQIGSSLDRRDERGGFIGIIDGSSIILSILNSINFSKVFGTEQLGGFIGYLESANQVTITGSYNYGDINGSVEEIAGFVGDSSSSANLTIEHSFNHGNILGPSEIGGFVGDAAKVIIRDSINFGEVKSSINDEQIGGLIGDAGDSVGDFVQIIRSANHGTIIGGGHTGVGGLVGELNLGSLVIEASYNVGTIIFNSSDINHPHAGGILGFAFNSATVTMSSVYNFGLVSGASTHPSNPLNIGGLLGGIGDTGNQSIFIENSYNGGLITGTGATVNRGALIGDESSTSPYTINDSHYLVGSAPSAFGLDDVDASGMSKSPLEMTDISSFNQWSIGANTLNTWSIGFNGELTYPWLSWQEEPLSVQRVDFITLGFIPISTPEDLRAIGQNQNYTFSGIYLGQAYEIFVASNQLLSSKYFLNNDIQFSVAVTDRLIAGTFTGTLNGNGFELRNLVVNGTNAYNGLFEKLDGALIQNLFINNFQISGFQQVGAIAGGIIEASETRIINVHVTNSSIIASSQNVGGFFGQIIDSSVIISQSSFEGRVESTSSGNVGGLIGRLQHLYSTSTSPTEVNVFDVQIFGNIEGSSNIGGLIGQVERGQFSTQFNIINFENVSNFAQISGSQNHVGGLIGIASSTTLSVIKSQNHGYVYGNASHVGGFIGSIGKTNENPTQSSILISDSLNAGTIEGGSGDVGGIIGLINNDAIATELRFVYSTGIISGSASDQGILIGEANRSVTFTSVVYLVQNALQPIGATSNSPTISGTPSGLHISQMVTLDTFVNAGWNIASDLSTTWAIGFEGGRTYPYLSHRTQPTDFQKVTLNQNQQFYLDKLNAGLGLINTRDDLTSLNVTGNYILTSDISLAGQDWTPIANFSGTLDGNGFTISDGNINQSGTNDVGFFKQISGASISNLTFNIFNVTGGSLVGLIVGHISGGINTLSSITVTNSSVHGVDNTGGLVGRNAGTKLTLNRIINHASVTSSRSGNSYNYNGGLIGISINELSIIESINYGNVSGAGVLNGGIVGTLWNNSIAVFQAVGNFGDVYSGERGAGGLIGGTLGTTLKSIEIYNSFNLGKVSTVQDDAGGIIGFIPASNGTNIVTFSSIYSAGEVTVGGVRAGLIFGRYDNVATELDIETALFSLNSLDVQVDGYTSGDDNDNPTSAFSTKIPPSQMSTILNFSNASWDISSDLNGTSVWVMGYENGQATYPWLRWMGEPNNSQLSP